MSIRLPRPRCYGRIYKTNACYFPTAHYNGCK
jgi:hypothetical protein